MKHSVRGFKLLVGIVFSVPLIIAIVLLGINIDRAKIARTGTETTAIIVDYYSSEEVNGVPYYKLEYVYEDADGNQHTGTTDSHYREAFVKNVVRSITTLQIKYTEDFKSVRADYKFKVDLIIIFLGIFGCVGVGFLTSLVVEIVRTKKGKKVAKYGKEKEGVFVSCRCGLEVNGEKFYSMLLYYMDDDNMYREVSTMAQFRWQEIQFFEKIQRFRIKEYNGQVVITENIDFARLNQIESERKNTHKKCAYCGGAVEKKLNKCPNCGASQFTAIKEDL